MEQSEADLRTRKRRSPPRGMGAVTAFGPSMKECQVMADHKESLTGLTDAEAQEFHKFMLQGTGGFFAASFVAHVLIWFWRPWF